MIFIFIGLIVVAFILLHKRAAEIVVINPLKGQRMVSTAANEEDPEYVPEDHEPESAPDLASLVSTIKQASQGGRAQGRAAIIAMIRNNQFIEAMQLYRRVYGGDLQAAKKAIDKMMLEK